MHLINYQKIPRLHRKAVVFPIKAVVGDDSMPNRIGNLTSSRVDSLRFNVPTGNDILVSVPHVRIRYFRIPVSGIISLARVGGFVPSVEITHNGHCRGIRSPNAEAEARSAPKGAKSIMSGGGIDRHEVLRQKFEIGTRIA